jgi:hypothetical protein
VVIFILPQCGHLIALIFLAIDLSCICFKPSPFGVNGATDCYQFYTVKTPIFSIDEAIYE